RQRPWTVSLSVLTPTPPPAIYTLSLHDALPISDRQPEVATRPEQPPERVAVLRRRDDQHVPDPRQHQRGQRVVDHRLVVDGHELDRKSTRLNSSHVKISYAVFCLKKKNLIGQEV